MTKFYCVKCRAYTETQDNEDWDEERRMMYGSCENCGKTKITFVNAKGTFRKKSAKELATARNQRKERTLNRKAKKLGRKILDADKSLQKDVRKYLKDA
jgi:hypothetical protein